MKSGVVISLLFAALTLASWAVVAITRPLAMRCRLTDVPNERSSHCQPTPLGGGLSIVLISLGACFFFAFRIGGISARHALAFAAATCVIALISLWDDFGHVPYHWRLYTHALAAGIFVFGFMYWSSLNLPVLGTVSLGFLGIPITVFWIVGLTNAYNFMDGVDGMAASQAVAASLGWCLLGVLTKHPFLIACGVVLGASSLGFLIHNWHPAKIFMGDVGSTFLGFSFATLPIVAARLDPPLALAGALLVWPAIFDSGFTIVRRLRKRENIFVGHKTFLFHRLVESGWSHSQAALFYLTLPVLGSLLALTWDKGTSFLHALDAGAIACLCWGLWLVVRAQERKVLLRVVPSYPANGTGVRQEDVASCASTTPSGSDRPSAIESALKEPIPLHSSRSSSSLGAVERRTGSDRRSGYDRRRTGRTIGDRRTGAGRRSSDWQPLVAKSRSGWM